LGSLANLAELAAAGAVNGFLSSEVGDIKFLIYLAGEGDLECVSLSLLNNCVKLVLWFVMGKNEHYPALFSSSNYNGSLSLLFLAMSLLDAIAF
jgi:hypothetical protein